MNSASTAQPVTTGPNSSSRIGFSTRKAMTVSLYQPGRLAHEGPAERLRQREGHAGSAARRSCGHGLELAPGRLAAAGLVEQTQQLFVRQQLVGVARRTTQHARRDARRANHGECRTRLRRADRRASARPARPSSRDRLRAAGRHRASAPCRSRCELSIAVALAQRVEAVALARMHLPRERERIEHRAEIAHADLRCCGGVGQRA